MLIEIVTLIGPEHEVWVQTYRDRGDGWRALNVGKVVRHGQRWRAFAAVYQSGHGDIPLLIDLGESFGRRSGAIDEVLRVMDR